MLRKPKQTKHNFRMTKRTFAPTNKGRNVADNLQIIKAKKNAIVRLNKLKLVDALLQNQFLSAKVN